MTAQIFTAEQVVPIQQLRALLLGPTVARLLYEDARDGTRQLAHYSITVGGTFGLAADECWCPLCGSGFGVGPTFAYACSQTSALVREGAPVGRGLLVLHRECVTRAQETGRTLDEWFADMEREANALVAMIEERGGLP